MEKLLKSYLGMTAFSQTMEVKQCYFVCNIVLNGHRNKPKQLNFLMKFL